MATTIRRTVRQSFAGLDMSRYPNTHDELDFWMKNQREISNSGNVGATYSTSLPCNMTDTGGTSDYENDDFYDDSDWDEYDCDDELMPLHFLQESNAVIEWVFCQNNDEHLDAHIAYVIDKLKIDAERATYLRTYETHGNLFDFYKEFNEEELGVLGF